MIKLSSVGFKSSHSDKDIRCHLTERMILSDGLKVSPLLFELDITHNMAETISSVFSFEISKHENSDGGLP